MREEEMKLWREDFVKDYKRAIPHPLPLFLSLSLSVEFRYFPSVGRVCFESTKERKTRRPFFNYGLPAFRQATRRVGKERGKRSAKMTHR